MTPDEAREIWYGQFPSPMDAECFARAVEAGETLGYIKREWDPLLGEYVNQLTSLGVLAWEKFKRDDKKRRKRRRTFER